MHAVFISELLGGMKNFFMQVPLKNVKIFFVFIYQPVNIILSMHV